MLHKQIKFLFFWYILYNFYLINCFIHKNFSGFNVHFIGTPYEFEQKVLLPSQKVKNGHLIRLKGALNNNNPIISVESKQQENNEIKKEAKQEKEKICFIAGIGDSNGYGWGIAKELSKKHVKLIFGIWPPIYNIFMTNYKNGKFEKDMIIDGNQKMNIIDIIPFDAAFDTYNDIDEETKNNKRYINLKNYSIEEAVNFIHKKFGSIDMLVHSLANGKEVQKDLLNTSRHGYLDAISKSSYSLISMCKYFSKILKPGSSIISLTYQASQKVVPGYGGGMSSAKAALESDTRVLAYHLGRNYKIRINTISAGPLKSRAASAINRTNVETEVQNKKNYNFIDYAIEYSEKYSPLQQKLYSTDVGAVASFLLSKEARAVTGQTIYVDNGLSIMSGPDDLFQNS